MQAQMPTIDLTDDERAALNDRGVLFERMLDFGFDVPISLSDDFYMLAIGIASQVEELILE
jgi:hypothetical protein